MTANEQNDGRPDWKRTLYITLIAHFVSSVGFSSTFPFLPLYVEKLGSVTFLGVGLLTGMVYAGQSFTMMIASPIWGNLADRFGRKIMVERAMFGGAVIIALMGFVRNAEELVILKAIQGVITGVMGANNAMVAAVTPREHLGRAMGLLQIAMGGGIAIGPFIGGVVADWWGYEMAFWVTAGSLLAGGVLVWRGIHEEFNPEDHVKDKKVSFWQGWRDVLSSKGVLVTYVTRFACHVSRSMVMPLLPILVIGIIGRTENMNSFTGLAFGINAIFYTLGAGYAAKAGDRIGNRLVLWVCLIASGLIYMLHFFVTEGWQILALQMGMGATLGGIMPSAGALLARYSKIGQEGRVYGLDTSVVSAARTVGPMLAMSCVAWFGVAGSYWVVGLISLSAGIAAWKMLPEPGEYREAE